MVLFWITDGQHETIYSSLIRIMCFFCMLFAFSVSLLDDGCKSNNQAKKEKRRPPGTVEFIVSETTARTRLNNLLTERLWISSCSVLSCVPSETHFTEELISCYRWDLMIPSTASHSSSTSPQTSWSSWTSSSLAASTPGRWEPRRQHQSLLQLPHYPSDRSLIGCPCS